MKRLVIGLFFLGVTFFKVVAQINDKWTIEPRFDYAGHFDGGLAIVGVNGNYGYIDKKGKFVVEPVYKYIKGFQDGLAAFSHNGSFWGFVDIDGNVAIQPLFDRVSPFIDGVAWGKRGSIEGFIDKNGNFICTKKYNKNKYKLLMKSYEKEISTVDSNKSLYVEVDYFPSNYQGKWGYKKMTLSAYVAQKIKSFNSYLSMNIVPIGTYEEYLKTHVEMDINQWQRKGEFEPTSKWKERVNESTRSQKINELTIKYRKEYESKLSDYKRRYAELSETYKIEYNKYRDEYYTQITEVKRKEFNNTSFSLMTYDADNQSFLIKSDKQGDILISVPLEEAPSFKQNWNLIRKTITPTFVPSGDDVVLTSVTVTNGNKKYVYDSHTQAKYAVTDINYNFDPVEISIPDVADVNYTFDPVEVIQSTVVQTSPNVQGLEANNAKVERKKINATKQSDVDMNIPQNITNKNCNIFAIIIANEDYQRVSDVQYANNDGKLFSEYCQKTLGLPQNHVMVYNDATLGNMLGAVNRIKEIGEAYNGKMNVIFYYAGHGIPDETSKDAFLLPVDGDGSSVRTCYKQSELYAELASIKAESVVVFMDACFSGALRGDGMLVAARGVAIKAKKSNPVGNMVVFSAAQGDETAYPYEEQRHGMFTYYLLKKLQETKGEATLGEISDYVTNEVRKQSIVINGKMQTPTLTSSSAIGDAWRNWKLK